MPDDTNATVLALGRLTVPELKQRYAEVFGEPTRTNHKQYLVKRIVWRMQALREGGLSERARRRAVELADDAEIRLSAPIAPLRGPGTVITAAFDGGRPAATQAVVDVPSAALPTNVSFRCSVLTPCGYSYSIPAHSTPHCPADLDDGSGTGSCDDLVTIDDLLFFLQAYAEGDARADLTGDGSTVRPDGGVTIEDLTLFLARYLAGC